LLPPAPATADWLARLQASGATLGDDSAYERLRVRAGEPAAGHELTDAYIPLELDLWGSVSFSKGCYIGQEILARMESRGKLARRLRGLRADAALTVGADVRALGADNTPTGGALGVVTSAAELPEVGSAGLAVLRSAVEPGAVVDAGGVRASVVELPFTA
jgi:aminomethyltransferase